MSKRQCSDPIEHIRKKIRKLERRLLKKQRRRSSTDSDSSTHASNYFVANNVEDDDSSEPEWIEVLEENHQDIYTGPSTSAHEVFPIMDTQEHDQIESPSLPTPRSPAPPALAERAPSPPNAVERAPSPQTPVERASSQPAPPERELSPQPGPSGFIGFNLPESTQVDAITEVQQATVVELDNLTLEILGEDPLATKSVGKDIQKDLAVRFEHLVTTGLTKELRKEILSKYLPPGNCSLVDAPTLNPEVKAAVSETVIKRDMALLYKQKQNASAISCLGEIMTMILSREEKDTALLKLLMDMGRILCDSQHDISTTRRSFILAVINKKMKDQLLQTKIDKLLFGKDFADTIKTAKAIHKSGADLKSSTIIKDIPKKVKPAPPPQRNLNWRAPPPIRRTAASTRTREATSKRTQHVPPSRPSYQPTNRGRR